MIENELENRLRRMLTDDEHLDWVRQQRDTVPLLTSVCSGSLVYAAAGLLQSCAPVSASSRER